MLDQLPEMITAFAAILWPVIVVLLILLYRSSVGKLIESAEKRGWTIEIGGQKLSMKELTTQQTSLIADLQKQLGDLKAQVQTLSGTAVTTDKHTATSDENRPFAVLWADDKPRNNAIFIKQLRDAGVKTDLGLSTAESMALFSRNRYRLVISDMGRTEDGSYHPEAGIELTRQIRKADHTIPVIIYSSSQAARQYKSRAEEARVTEITSSPSRLAQILSEHQLTHVA